MRPLYVIAEQGTGKLYAGDKMVRDYYTGERMSAWITAYPNKKKPVLYASKAKAKERLEYLSPYFYVRRARGRELKWATPEQLSGPKGD